ncbi:MAG TPA: DnaJ domain-containing protein [Candidatus Binatia bacterium]|nr:DnaJ domain-containing protein [Candidatus Binatia bacterium]
MIDHFAVLDQPRRAWLDPEALKAKFLSLSATVHPDRVHGQSEDNRNAAQERYTQLNAAYQCLRETKARLHHLLELERGAKLQDVQEIPPETMDLFFQVGKLCREADQMLAEKRQTNSPLLKVQLFERTAPLQEALNRLATGLRTRISALEDELKPSPPPPRLEAIYRLVSYYTRWLAQLQERAVQLIISNQ